MQLSGSCRPGVRHLLRDYRLAQLVLFQVYRPVRGLDFDVQLAAFAGKLIEPSTNGSDIKRPDEPNLRTAIASLLLCGRIGDRLQGSVQQAEHVTPSQPLRQCHPRCQVGPRVSAIDARNQPLELAGDFVELAKQRLRILRRAVAFLHERADPQPISNLNDPGLQLIPARKRLSKLPRHGSGGYRSTRAPCP